MKIKAKSEREYDKESGNEILYCRGIESGKEGGESLKDSGWFARLADILKILKNLPCRKLLYLACILF